MKKTRKNRMLKGILLTFVLTFGVFVWSSDSIISLAAGTAKVVANTGMIREKADKNSEAVGSVKKGDSLEVISSASDGTYTWYKVYVNSEKTGYIREDLVTVEGNISAESTNEVGSSSGGGTVTVVGSNKNTQTQKTEGNKETVTEVNVSETDVATAKTNADVRVRKGAGTNFDVAGNAKKNTEVAVSGVAADQEGKNWYQVNFTQDGKSTNGFIREDFLEVLTYVEVLVEEPVEEIPEVEEEPVIENPEYELQYRQNDMGEMDWYLNNNLQGTSQSLTQILDVIEQIENQKVEEAKQISTMRIIIAITMVVIVILIVVVTILVLKLRDAYEYEYEDDEEEEDDEENSDEEIVVKEEKASKKSSFGFLKKKQVSEEEDDEEDEEEDTLEEIQPEKPVKTKKAENKAWQSKDFLELDDDMEFEFLDL